jgi:hypothetical protein
MSINLLKTAVFVLLLVSTAVSSQAQACLGPSEEFTVFFEVAPKHLKDETVAKVKIMSQKNGLVRAKVISLVKAKNNTIKSGDRIILKYPISSCTRDVAIGDVGTIVIKGFVNSDDEKDLIAHIYQRRYRDNFLQ